jgi:hypothetical protein
VFGAYLFEYLFPYLFRIYFVSIRIYFL